MKRLWIAAAVLATAGLSAQASIAGKWNMSVDTQQGVMANALDLKVDGKKVTGTLTSQMGSAPVEGEFANGTLALAMSFDTPNGAMDIAIRGTLKADGTLEGTLSGGQGAFEFAWKAERVKDSPAATGMSAQTAPPKLLSIVGKWTMAFEIPMGTATPVLELKQDGEKISGTYTGRYGTVPLSGTLKARALAFTLTVNAEGQSAVMTFSGEVAADGQTMAGTATIEGLGDVSWTAKKNPDK